MAKFQELIDRSDTSEGLKRIRWEFLVENPALWAVDDVISRFSEFPSEALQVIVARFYNMPVHILSTIGLTIPLL
jgi:hypothetical protein